MQKSSRDSRPGGVYNFATQRTPLRLERKTNVQRLGTYLRSAPCRHFELQQIKTSYDVVAKTGCMGNKNGIRNVRVVTGRQLCAVCRLCSKNTVIVTFPIKNTHRHTDCTVVMTIPSHRHTDCTVVMMMSIPSHRHTDCTVVMITIPSHHCTDRKF